MIQSWLKNINKRFGNAIGVGSLADKIEEAKILSARIIINQLTDKMPLTSIHDAEFKVFSQFGDDGIIQYLIKETGIREEEKKFIEFGVHDYQESNTRFLLMNDNWRGFIMDGSYENIKSIHNSSWYWQYDLTAVCAFITVENINTLLSKYSFDGEVGILSIDIDGND